MPAPSMSRAWRSVRGGRARPGRPRERLRAGHRGLGGGAAIAGLALVAALLPGAVLADGATGAITGTVLDATRAPAGAVLVFACGTRCTHAISAADGTFSVGGLAAGSYRVGIDDLSGRLPGGYATATSLTTSAADAALVPVDATAVPFDVHAPAGQRLSGTITASAGGPLQDVLVEACVNIVYAADPGFMPCGFDMSEADGGYALAVLPGTYEVGAFDLAYTHASVYYATGRSVFAQRQATPLTVGTSDIAGIDIALPSGSSIAGTVTNSGGTPVMGIDVLACLVADPSACGLATTAADGSYTASGLPAGSYSVGFIDPNAEYPTGFYGGAGFTGDSSAIKAVALGETGASGIDVRLPAGRVVSGVVTDAAGRPVRVAVDDCTGSLCIGVTRTAADGSYRINVAPGQHAIHVGDYSGANLSGYYSAAGLANRLHATRLVGSDDLTGINVRLRSIGSGIHAGTAHTGSYVSSTTVARGAYATARFTFGKEFAGTRVTILRATKSSGGAWSTFRSVATLVVAVDGNAYYSAKVSGSIAFKAQESDPLVFAVQVLSVPVYVRSR